MKQAPLDFKNDNVRSLFRKLLIPTLLGSLAMSAVTAIDGIFVGHGVGPDGVAAVNIFVPIYMIMSGISLMIGVGCSVVASIHLAQHKETAARLNVTHAILLTSLIVVPIILFSMIFPAHTAQLLGSSETLLPNVQLYLQWIMPTFIFEMWTVIGLFIIRLDGSPQYAMWCNIIPALLNAILDWLFIFPLNMGIKGAAVATAISIVVGGIMAIIYLLFFAKSLRLMPIKINYKNIIHSIRNFGYQCKVGFSSLLGELSLAFFVYIGNMQFMHYMGDAGVGAFGIACYYNPFCFMVGNSIAQSAQPIISYNYGIAKWQQVKEARNLLLQTATLFGILFSALFIIFPKELVGLFVDTQSTAGVIAIEGFPYFGPCAIFFILNISLIGYYQSLEKIKKSILFVVMRGLIFLLPAFLLLPKIIGTKGLWLAMLSSEFLTLASIFILHISSKKSYAISQ